MATLIGIKTENYLRYLLATLIGIKTENYLLDLQIREQQNNDHDFVPLKYFIIILMTHSLQHYE